MKLLSRFWTDESGATAIEYGLIDGRHLDRYHRYCEWPGHQPQQHVHLGQQLAEIIELLVGVLWAGRSDRPAFLLEAARSADQDPVGMRKRPVRSLY